MAQGPHLIFDKSSLESLNLDEAALLDNFYTSNITPLFLVECLADLEKSMVRMRITPEQLVGSLATRTPDTQSYANIHHMRILESELMGRFQLSDALHRPHLDPGEPVRLADSKGMIFRQGPEEEALNRWQRHDFLDVERSSAKAWRRALLQIDFDSMVNRVMQDLGHWRKPGTLADAKSLSDTIIDNMDPEWLLSFGLQLLGVSGANELVITKWRELRKPSLREHLPYFIHLLSINIFFCLVLPTQLLRNVKPSHQIDLAYLYYLPFCSVFTSRDNFHVKVAPLFLAPGQEFVHGDDLKADLKCLNEHYSRLPEEVLDQGLYSFANFPPNDERFLTTRLWDKYLPSWRSDARTNVELDAELKKALGEMTNRLKNSQPRVGQHLDTDKLDYVTMSRKVFSKKGRFLRFPKEVILANQEEERRKG